MSDRFDPYHKWLGIPPEEQPPNHYRLLGIGPFEADADVIQSAADQRMSHVRTFQAGQYSAQSQQLLNALAAARICLLKPERKATYDAELKKRFAAAKPVVVQTVAPVKVVSAPVPKAVVTSVRTVAPAKLAVPTTPLINWAEEDMTVVPARRRKQGMAGLPAYLVAAACLLILVVAGASFWRFMRPAVAELVDAGRNWMKPTSNEPAEPNNPQPPAPVDPEKNPSPTEAPDNTVATAPAPTPPPVQPRRKPFCIDNDDPGFKTIGADWSIDSASQAGYKQSHHVHPAGPNKEYASWTFDALESGKYYDIFVTWVVKPTRAPSVRYVVTGVANEPQAVQVNQQLAPNTDARFNNHAFQKLGSYQCTGNTLTVQLNAIESGGISADAVLMVPTRPPTERVATNTNTPPQPAPVVPASGIPVQTAVRPANKVDDPSLLMVAQQPITGLAMLADGAQAAVSTLDPNLPASLWNLDQRVEQKRIQGVQTTCLSVTGLPDRPLFFVGGEDGGIVAWDLRDSAAPMQHVLSTNSGAIERLVALADGRTLAVGGRSSAWLMRYVIAGEPKNIRFDIVSRRIDLPAPLTAIAVPPDAGHVILGRGGSWVDGRPEDSGDSQLYVYDVTTNQMKTIAGHGGGIWGIALADDGKRMATACYDGKVRLWSNIDGKLLQELSGHDGAVLCVALSRDGNTLVSGGTDGTVRLWNASSGRMMSTWQGHHAPVRAVDIDGRGRRVVSGGQDGELRLWDVTNRTASGHAAALVAKLPKPPSDAARAVARKLMEEAFASDFSEAKLAEDKLALAERLLAQSEKSSDDAERYVLVDEARKLATAAGELNVALNAIRDLAARYDIDAWDQTATTTEEIGKTLNNKLANKLARKEFAENVRARVETALAEDEYDTAQRMLAAASAAAKKSDDSTLAKQITARSLEVAELAKAHGTVRKAIETLRATPDDPEANLILGSHFCFRKEDWATGLPHLQKSSDTQLAKLAEQELEDPLEAGEQMKLADAWIEQAATAADAQTKRTMLSRAELWYRESLPKLSGLAETKAQKRLDEVSEQIGVLENDPGAAKETGPTGMRGLIMQIRAAIKSGNVTRTPLYGAHRVTGGAFPQDAPMSGALLVGFNYTVENGDHLSSLQPVFLGGKTISGAMHGNPTRGVPATAMARKGYAVGGIECYGSGQVRSFDVIFMKIGKTGLDPKDTYRSGVIGNGQIAGSSGQQLGGDGRPVIGICGSARPWGLETLGLIQLGK